MIFVNKQFFGRKFKSCARKARLLNRALSYFNSDLQLLQNVVSEKEHEILINYLSTLLKRRKYEGNHWDDVISQYKEIELSRKSLPDEIAAIMDNLQSIITKSQIHSINRFEPTFLQPHVIDLAQSGHIGPHIDSVKFSGDLIAGLSLLSTRTMILSPDPETVNKTSNEVNSPPNSGEGLEDTNKNLNISMILEPRSLYILRGKYRYNYRHEIVGPSSEEMKQLDSLKFDRRISVIFRNEK